MSIAGLKGGLDGCCHFVRFALPGTEANGWDLGAGVELECFPVASHVSDCVYMTSTKSHLELR